MMTENAYSLVKDGDLSLSSDSSEINDIGSGTPPELLTSVVPPQTICREIFLDKFEKFANLIATGWKYHVANTDGIREAWSSFENLYMEVCSLATVGQHHVPMSSADGFERFGTPGLLDPRTGRISEEFCEKIFMERLEVFMTQFSSEWKTLISHHEGIKEAWQEFQHFFMQICSMKLGKLFLSSSF